MGDGATTRRLPPGATNPQADTVNHSASESDNTKTEQNRFFSVRMIIYGFQFFA